VPCCPQSLPSGGDDFVQLCRNVNVFCLQLR
jgi:hypothetical protein